MASKPKYFQLTIPLRNLLNEIQASDLDVYGYRELILLTLRTGRYHAGDQAWLNCVRRKWINHLKEKQNKKRIYEIYLRDE